MSSIEAIRDPSGRVIAHFARWRDRDGKQRKKKFRLKRDAEAHLIELEAAKARSVDCPSCGHHFAIGDR